MYPPLATYWPNLAQASPQQTAFLLLDQREALYGGAAGGGKSDALLAAALQYVDQPEYAAIIVRRTFAELALPDAIMDRSHQWLTKHKPAVHWNGEKKTWTFPSGATLTFGFVEQTNDVYRYQGSAYQFVGWDELTQWPDDVAYKYLSFSRQRRLANSTIPIRTRAASNPGNVGHGWVLKRFPILPGQTPAGHEGRVFIPAKVYDNPGLDADEYALTLAHLDDIFRQQLLDGDWGAFEGMAFSFGPEHVAEPFELPSSFERFESMDYGLNNPTAWIAWAVDYEGNLIAFDEHYEPGLPSDTAHIILRLRYGWGSNLCFGDPNSLAMRTGTRNRWGDQATIETEFADNGVNVIRGNDNPRAGYARLRELLKLDPNHRFPDWHPRRGETGAPRLYVMERACPHLAEQFRTAPVQPLDKPHAGEMIDPKWESRHGHAVAAARYGVLSRPAPSIEPPPWATVPPHLREAWVDHEAMAAQLRRDALDAVHRRSESEAGRRRTERV